MINRSIRRILLFFATFIAISPLSQATLLISVVTTADSGPGSLRQAIIDGNAAPPDTEVIITLDALQLIQGPSQIVIELSSGPLVITRAMQIVKTDAPRASLRNTLPSGRILEFDPGTDGEVLLRQIEFRGGRRTQDPWQGGAIFYAQNNTAANAGKKLNLTLNQCLFIDNMVGTGGPTGSTSAQGGAIHFNGAVAPGTVRPFLALENCLFKNCVAVASTATSNITSSGAAIYVTRTTLMVTDCGFIENSSNSSVAHGATIYLVDPLPGSTIARCHIHGNTLGSGVSGITVTDSDSDLLVDSCLFTDNGSLQSASVFSIMNSAKARLLNSTLTGNMSQQRGAISWGGNVQLEILHCTITENIHQSVSGAALQPGSGTGSPSITIHRSIIAGNLPSSGSQSSSVSPDVIPSTANITADNFTSGGYNIIGSGVGTGGIFTAAGDRVGASNAALVNPSLAPLADYGGPLPTMPPTPDSPAVDLIAAGAPSNLVPSDARGTSRPQGNFADSGAVELPRIPFNTWSTSLPPGQQGPADDPDGDGLANRLEYFFGTHGNQFTPNPVRVTRDESGTHIEFDRWTWVRPAFFNSWRIEVSSDLAQWTPLTQAPVVSAKTPGSIDYLNYRYTVAPDAADGPSFYRLAAD